MGYSGSQGKTGSTGDGQGGIQGAFWRVRSAG